jgi:Flp pilus assembly protein TadG
VNPSKHAKDGRRESGSAAAEFALIAPVLIFFLLGLIDVGRYMFYGILASHAARAGVQYGTQTSMTALDNTGIQNAALQDAQGLSGFQAHATVLCTVSGASSSCPANNTGSIPTSLVYYVEVTVTGSFNTLIKYPGIPSTVPVTGNAIMRLGSQ